LVSHMLLLKSCLMSSSWNPWVSIIGIISLGYKYQAKISLN
jgi:hypothetical protein